MKKDTEIVITGMGCVTPAGVNVKEFWESCKNSISGLKKHYNTNISYKNGGYYFGSINNIDESGDSKLLDIAVTATREALNDAEIDLSRCKKRIAFVVSTSKPNLITNDRTFASYYSGFSSLIAQRFSCQAIICSTVSSCASGLSSLLIAKNMLLDREVDLVICGATDSAISPLLIAAYKKMGVLIPEYRCSLDSFYPFDKRRKGFYPGEGCGIIVLEKRDHAIFRRAKIYGKLAKILVLSEAYHETAMDPSGSGVFLVLHHLLKDNGRYIWPDYISLHGTATKINDTAETRAIKMVFGKNAYDLVMSAIKPFTGHMISASSIVEVISCLLAINDGYIPPTLNLKEIDPECDLNYVPGKGIEKHVNNAISLSYGFGSLVGGALLKKMNIE